METVGFHEDTLSVQSKSTEHGKNTHIDNVNNVNILKTAVFWVVVHHQVDES
jgi:hypothetical protein